MVAVKIVAQEVSHRKRVACPRPEIVGRSIRALARRLDVIEDQAGRRFALLVGRVVAQRDGAVEISRHRQARSLGQRNRGGEIGTSISSTTASVITDIAGWRTRGDGEADRHRADPVGRRRPGNGASLSRAALIGAPALRSSANRPGRRNSLPSSAWLIAASGQRGRMRIDDEFQRKRDRSTPGPSGEAALA